MKFLLSLLFFTALPCFAITETSIKDSKGKEYRVIIDRKIIVVYFNKCQDIDPENPDWDCLNETQAAHSEETLSQVKRAVKKSGYRGKLVINSIDPIRGRDYWEYGAWQRGGFLFFAAMPGCPNAIKDLTKLLRKMKWK